MTRTRLMILLLALLVPFGCKSAYYSTMEAMGSHKRDLLVDRVGDARDEQAETKEEFRTALDTFTELVGYEGGDLRDIYDRLNGELEGCEDRAESVRDHIESIETVAADLFAEWEEELDQYANDQLRSSSAVQLRRTQARYEELIGAMKRAEKTMEPVLAAFRDQVLFLKHNLNAQAIASLEGNVATLESDIAELIAEMETSIAEADAFIEAMGSS